MGRSAAYGRMVAERRRRGERIGLLVVAMDWQSGKNIAERPNVARVVVTEDLDVSTADWSFAAGLDCLVLGGNDAPAFASFYAVCTALQRAEAASLWGDFEDGLWRLEPFTRNTPWMAIEGPFPEAKLGAAVARYRLFALLCASGVYGAPAFAPARKVAFKSVFGDEADAAQRAVLSARRELREAA